MKTTCGNISAAPASKKLRATKFSHMPSWMLCAAGSVFAFYVEEAITGHLMSTSDSIAADGMQDMMWALFGALVCYASWYMGKGRPAKCAVPGKPVPKAVATTPGELAPHATRPCVVSVTPPTSPTPCSLRRESPAHKEAAATVAARVGRFTPPTARPYAVSTTPLASPASSPFRQSSSTCKAAVADSEDLRTLSTARLCRRPASPPKLPSSPKCRVVPPGSVSSPSWRTANALAAGAATAKATRSLEERQRAAGARIPTRPSRKYTPSALSSPSAAERQIEELKRSGAQPDTALFNAVIHAGAKEGDIARCEAWIGRMAATGVKPDRASFNCIIDACVKANLPDDAELWLTRMKEHGLAPNAVTYSTLIHGCAKRGEVALATHWFERCLEDQVEANIVIYNSLISACARSGEVHGAERWLKDAEERGLKGTVTTYSALVDACAKRGEVGRAEHWMSVMVEQGITPNVVSYGSMIDACSKSSCPRKAKEWHHRMLEQGVEPNMHTFSAAISGCAKAGDIAAAEELLASMADFGVVEEAIVYNGVIDACAKVRDSTRAMRIFKQMGANNVKPTIVTFASVARAFAHIGDWRTVEDLERDLLEQGLQPNEYFLYSRLCSYASAQPREPRLAEAAFLDARRAGIPINSHLESALARAVGGVRAQQLLSATW